MLEETKEELAKEATVETKQQEEATNAAPSPTKKKAFSTFSKVKTARTEEYADDSSLYVPRVGREERLQYYGHLIQNKAPFPSVPNEFEGFTNQNSLTEKLLEQYSTRLKKFFRFVISPNWDFAYFYGLILWVIFTAAVVDGFVPASLGFTYQSQIVLLPVVVMLLSQIIPSIFSVLIIRHCNDLSRQMAQTDFINWSLVSVMLMQYIERFYYSGIYQSDKGGKVSGLTYLTLFETVQIVLFGKIYTAAKIYPQSNVVAEQPLEAIAEEADDEDEDIDEDESRSKAKSEEDERSEAHSVDKSVESVKPPSNVDSAVEGKNNSSDEEEMGYLARQRKKLEREQAEAKRIELEERLAREALVTEWIEWDCVCCGKHNRRPATMPVQFDIKFGSKGVYYKRHFAKLKQKSTKPDCLHCFTPCDYKPPLATAHLFPNNPRKDIAFDQYPKVVTHHPQLKTDKTSLRMNAIYNLFFGIGNDINSQLLPNDWRLPKYLATIFPQVPRYIKPPEEYYEIGEFVECKYQKVDWSRCVIKSAHSNHTYDIKFNTGDEIRFVYEVHLRCPPAKGNYIYRVELAMTIWYILFPATLLGAIVATPALLFLPPFFISIILLIVRTKQSISNFLAAKKSGICAVFRLWLFFTLPLIMLMIGGILGLSGSYFGAVVCIVIAKLSSILILYSMRPTWAIFCSGIFLFSSIGLIALTMFISGSVPYVSIAFGPLLIAALIGLHFRRGLPNLWDVQLRCRIPPISTNPTPPEENPPAVGSVVSGDIEAGGSIDQSM